MAKRNKLLLRYALVPIALLLGFSLIPGWLTPGQAVTFKPPRDQAPKQSTGGASRDGGKCFSEATKTNASMTPLMPTTNQGLTVVGRPTFFVYVPQTSAKKVFFSLQDEDTTDHYQTTFLLPNKPGVSSFRLPDSAPALQIGKNYKWSWVLLCEQQLEPDSPGVSGWIRRVKPNPSLVNQRKVGASLESASKLASIGIWYDALSTLAELRRSQPENSNITASWEELLKSVGLDAIATEPLTDH